MRESCDASRVFAAIGGDDDALSYLSAGLTEVARDDTVAGPRRPHRDPRPGRRRRRDARRAGAARRSSPTPDDELPELSVMASGCLGLVSFPRLPGRVPLERIEELYPALIPALRDHPGIGFVMVRSEARRRAGDRRPRRPPPRLASGSTARTRWPRSGPTPPATCAAPTPSRTAPT